MHDTIIDSATMHVHSAIYDTVVITVVNWDQKNTNTNILTRTRTRTRARVGVCFTRSSSQFKMGFIKSNVFGGF